MEHQSQTGCNTALSRPLIAASWTFVLLLITGTVFQILPVGVVRAGAFVALLLYVFFERQSGSGQFLTSPLFLLGSFALLFFSFVLAVAPTLPIVLKFQPIELFYGSDAERIIIIFGLCCLVSHNALLIVSKKFPKALETEQPNSRLRIYVFAGIALCSTLVNIVNFELLKLGGPHFESIRSIIMPVIAFSLIYLVRQVTDVSRNQKILILMVILISAVGLLHIGEGKKPVFILVAGLLFWLRLKKPPMRTLIILGLGSVFGAVILLQTIKAIREPVSSILIPAKIEKYTGKTPADMFWVVLYGKLVLRQTETRYCFQNVLDEHWQQPFSFAKQKFWMEGMVPRFFWRDKPSLSFGRLYKTKYCKSGEDNGPHSASITLLGQPVINGGMGGLMLNGGILISCLGALTWFSRDPRRLSSLIVVALLPWLIDFDQDFALFIANAVKFFLIMLPLVFLVNRLEKHQQGNRI